MVRVLLRSLKAVGSGIRTGWLLLGITLVLIIVTEAALRLALETKARLMPTEVWTQADMYRNVEWARDFFREHHVAERTTWAPYVHWEHPPLQGRYINMDRNGLRATWNPPPQDVAGDPPPVRVFTFGGSTMWGWGVRDHYTIASHLGKLLHAKGHRAEVMNYGKIAYVSTQDVIALLRCIQRGEIPDIALFYHGINEVLASYEHGKVGYPLRSRFRCVEPDRGPWAQGQEFLSGNFWGFRRFVAGLRRRIRPWPLRDTGPDESRPTFPVNDETARQMVRVYEANLAAIESLGRRYGFEPLFYWQPVLFSKRHRSPHEQTIVERVSMHEKKFDDIYRRVRRSEALNSHPRFHDISDLFDDSKEPYYLDGWHLSEPGNRLIAAAMVDDVIELIEQRRTAVVGPVPVAQASRLPFAGAHLQARPVCRSRFIWFCR